jgi:hypothetical protein
MDWFGLTQERQAVDSCELSNERLGSIKMENF